MSASDHAAPDTGRLAYPPADPSLRGSTSLRVAVVVLFVLSAALAVVAAVLASRLEDEGGDRRAVEQIAGQFAAALLTYDYTDLEQARRRVLALSTGKFRSEYERAFGGGLRELLAQTESRSEGTVTDVFVARPEDESAEAIVVANAVATGTTGTKRTVASYIQLQLVRVGGRWKVDGVTNLNFGQQEGDGQAPATTPTTAGK